MFSLTEGTTFVHGVPAKPAKKDFRGCFAVHTAIAVCQERMKRAGSELFGHSSIQVRDRNDVTLFTCTAAGDTNEQIEQPAVPLQHESRFAATERRALWP